MLFLVVFPDTVTFPRFCRVELFAIAEAQGIPVSVVADSGHNYVYVDMPDEAAAERLVSMAVEILAVFRVLAWGCDDAGILTMTGSAILCGL
ncbi:hypothetical protein KIPB_012472 [Kipferlia bialata]|uniref:tRNA (guanine(10)-N(2))-methyltransferase TRMT11 N-terminal domain-containing protein n=1 Tax=Kipferlia bialata TaxID=797122 RepID=A0A9K3D7I8_9EUKA|nr:hypothetical protein KIPB_012472 [Kipferlia bialata]|eukprot:g12472.t1